MYRVIRDFSDLQDHLYVYRAGDVYPRSNTTASEKRIESLLSTDNIRRVPLIQAVPDAKEDISLATEKAEEPKTGAKSTESLKAKGKQKRGQKKHA